MKTPWWCPCGLERLGKAIIGLAVLMGTKGGGKAWDRAGGDAGGQVQPAIIPGCAVEQGPGAVCIFVIKTYVTVGTIHLKLQPVARFEGEGAGR